MTSVGGVEDNRQTEYRDFISGVEDEEISVESKLLEREADKVRGAVLAT